jgi:hypothetical protein
LNSALKKAYYYGCQKAIDDFTKHASLSSLEKSLVEALAAGALGAGSGYATPYYNETGLSFDRDERALRGALAGGLVGSLGGFAGSRVFPLLGILAGGTAGSAAGARASADRDSFL